MKNLIFFLLLTSGLVTHANHLLGGTISSVFISTTNSKVIYQVSLELYLDCESSSVFFDDSVLIGVYHNDKNKNLYKSVSIRFTNRKAFKPQCNSTYTQCIEGGIYTKNLEFDSSSSGYILRYERCCRSNHDNITSGFGANYNGFSIISYLSTTYQNNNSPEFTFNPTQLLPVYSNRELDLRAMDSNGDSLVYSIVEPLNGGSNSVPIPVPSDTLNNNKSLTYYPNYSFSKPFGNNGTISIHNQTGLVKIYNREIGRFAFSYEVKEYRNNVLIGIYRKDYPLVFVSQHIDSSKFNIILSNPKLYASKFVDLDWRICPISIPKYSIERRTNASGWTEIARTKTNLNYTDTLPWDIWYYYRIRAFIDGKDIYSNMDSACFCFTNKINPLTNKIWLYPNPVQHFLNIKGIAFNEYAIYDVTGKLHMNIILNSDSTDTTIDLKNLMPGCYHMVVKSATKSYRQRFIKIP